MEAATQRTELPSTSSLTQTINQPATEPPVLRLRLQKPRNAQHVVWREDTVDNEHMNKKKSKCCCIYKKPTKFGESSSEDDEECEHCFGHPEKKRRNRKKNADQPNAEEPENTPCDGCH